MQLIFWILIFLVSLFVLVKASDYFTESAENIGIHFGIPAFIVGVTIVAIGTSLPELVTSLIAVFDNSTEIVAGNVIGSNIANIFLILGIAAIIGKKLKIDYELIHVDLPLLISSAFLLAICVWDGKFTWLEGILCICAFLIYLFYTISTAKSNKEEKRDIKEEIQKDVKVNLGETRVTWKTWGILALSTVFIYIGAKYTIESVIALSDILNIGKQVIAVSAVALGTSLPELVVTISAAKRGNPEMAVGNVLGSNIFNALIVMGIPSLFSQLTITQDILIFSLPVMIIATLLYYFVTQDKQITKWEGWMLLIFYVVFIGKIFELF